MSKESKKVEVKLLIPYAIIAIATALLIGIGSGWFLKAHMEGQVRQTVAADMAIGKAALKANQ